MEGSPKQLDSLSLEEIREKMEEIKVRFRTCERSERLKIAEESREVFAVEFNRASTYQEYLDVFYDGLHPEDRKMAYLKTIEHAPTKEIAQQLFSHSFDKETKQAAEEKIKTFS